MTVPVVLLHGFGTSSARTWGDNGWLDLLADAGREAIGIDLLGHGNAPKPHDPAAYEAMGEYVAAQLPPGPVDAIGFSLGARTLLEMAVDKPDRFRRIVTLGVGANLMRPYDTDPLIAAVGGTGDATNPMAQYFARLVEHPASDPEALAAVLRARRELLTPERLSVVDVPVLVVIGDRDFAGPGDPLADALPQSRLLVLPGVDHFATPKDFGAIDAALDFLSAKAQLAPLACRWVDATHPEEKNAVSIRARRLAALATHHNTNAEVARRIRASLRRYRLSLLASHPRTDSIVAGRIAQALKNDAGRRAA